MAPTKCETNTNPHPSPSLAVGNMLVISARHHGKQPAPIFTLKLTATQRAFEVAIGLITA